MFSSSSSLSLLFLAFLILDNVSSMSYWVCLFSSLRIWVFLFSLKKNAKKSCSCFFFWFLGFGLLLSGKGAVTLAFIFPELSHCMALHLFTFEVGIGFVEA